MIRRIAPLLIFAAVAGLVMTTLPTFSATKIDDEHIAGQVARLKANAIAVQDAEIRSLSVGSTIYVDDVISTGPNARIELKMIDDSVLRPGERTIFVVIDYAFKGRDGKAIFRLLKGSVRAVTGKLAKLDDKPFTLETELATVGIRGTDFFAGYIHDEFHVGLLGGDGVYVENSAGRVEITKIGDGTKINGMISYGLDTK